MQSTSTNQSRYRGFTLIEVMIAVLVLSIGLLAVASLQLTAKRSTHQAWQRSLAVSIADSMVERIRANPSVAKDYHTGLAAPLGGGSISTAPTDCGANACNPTAVRQWDQWRWERQLDSAGIRASDDSDAGGLIDPRGCVVFDKASATGTPNTGKIQVVVSWKGLVETSDAVASGSACGTGNAGTQKDRRQVVVNSYIVAEEDLNP